MLFISVFLVVLVRAVRHPRRASFDAALFFAVPAAVISQGLIAQALGRPGGEMAQVSAAILMALPLLTLRLINRLTPVPPPVLWAAFVGWLGSVVLLTASPPIPQETTALGLIAYFAAFELYAGVITFHAARRSSGVTRRRLVFVAWGTLLLGLTLLDAGIATVVPPLAAAAGVLALGSAFAYVLGFATPRFVRRMWQEPLLRRFLSSAVQRSRQPDLEAVITALLRDVASATGGVIAIGIWDDVRGVLRFHTPLRPPYEAKPEEVASGAAFTQQRPLLAVGDRSTLIGPMRAAGMSAMIATPISTGLVRYGVLGIYAPRSWLFAEDDLELLEAVAAQVAIILENHDLYSEVRTLNSQLEARVAELGVANDELASFAYAVSHDLRAPLRAIDGFSEVILDEKGDALGADGREHLGRVRLAAQNMGQLIDDLLELSRMTRAELRRAPVDLSALARAVAADQAARTPDREVTFVAAEGMQVVGDERLLRVALDNLIGNAWKFTRPVKEARIEMGVTQHNGTPAFHVRDNGVGFEMQYADKLFVPFQRLHSFRDFEGTGVGLATVRRIVRRHGGDIWAESGVGNGATFTFTLPGAS